jgi:hypothetical protein
LISNYLVLTTNYRVECFCLGLTIYLRIEVEHLVSLTVYCNCTSYQSTVTLIEQFVSPLWEARVFWGFQSPIPSSTVC